MHRLKWFLVVIGCLLPSFAGCRKTAHHDEEEEEHFPLHWPHSFVVASDRLNLIAEKKSSVETQAPSVQQELADLIDWLPELVADSSASKKEFDSVDVWAYPLATQLKKWASEGRSVDEMLECPGLIDGIKMLSRLAEVERERMRRDEEERRSDVNPNSTEASASEVIENTKQPSE